MSYGVQDRLMLQLSISGEVIPLKDNMIDWILISETTRIFVPMMSLVLRDMTKFFTRKNLIVDGAPIELTIEAEKVRTVYYFRLFSFKEAVDQGVTSYRISGYLDVPKYWTESSVNAIHGSVSAALQRICAATGLRYDGITTAESQVWLPANRRNAQFARYISEHAWVSDNSCCQMVVTPDKVMRLVDISKMATRKPVQYFSNKDNTENQQVITDVDVLSKAGFFNSASGYRETKVVQSTLTDNPEVIKDLTLTKNTKRMMMNEDVRSGISQNKVSHSPIDIGNVSTTYERAVYQNRRLSGLFAFGLEFVTPRPVTAQLLDTVNCEIAKPGLDGVEAYNGKYLLTGKILYVKGMNLFYKCEVLRHGLNTAQETTQM